MKIPIPSGMVSSNVLTVNELFNGSLIAVAKLLTGHSTDVGFSNVTALKINVGTPTIGWGGQINDPNKESNAASSAPVNGPVPVNVKVMVLGASKRINSHTVTIATSALMASTNFWRHGMLLVLETLNDIN